MFRRLVALPLVLLLLLSPVAAFFINVPPNQETIGLNFDDAGNDLEFFGGNDEVTVVGYAMLNGTYRVGYVGLFDNGVAKFHRYFEVPGQISSGFYDVEVYDFNVTMPVIGAAVGWVEFNVNDTRPIFISYDDSGTLLCSIVIRFLVGGQNQSWFEGLALTNSSGLYTAYAVGTVDGKGLIAAITQTTLLSCRVEWVRVVLPPTGYDSISLVDIEEIDGSGAFLALAELRSGQSIYTGIVRISSSGLPSSITVINSATSIAPGDMFINGSRYVMIVGSQQFTADPNMVLMVLDPNLSPACGVEVDIDVFDRATGVEQDGYGNIHVSGYYEGPGNIGVAVGGVFFPDCRPIQFNGYLQTTSRFMDVETYVNKTGTPNYGSVTYYTGWVSNGFPNDFPQINYSYKPLNISVTTYTPNRFGTPTDYSRGVLNPLNPTINAPVNQDILLMRVSSNLPIIPEVPVPILLLVAAMAMVVVLRRARWVVSRGSRVL